jgi:hypothetical protein
VKSIARWSQKSSPVWDSVYDHREIPLLFFCTLDSRNNFVDLPDRGRFKSEDFLSRGWLYQITFFKKHVPVHTTGHLDACAVRLDVCLVGGLGDWSQVGLPCSSTRPTSQSKAKTKVEGVWPQEHLEWVYHTCDKSIQGQQRESTHQSYWTDYLTKFKEAFPMITENSHCSFFLPLIPASLLGRVFKVLFLWWVS